MPFNSAYDDTTRAIRVNTVSGGGSATLSASPNFIGLVTATLGGSMITVTQGTLNAGEDLTNDVQKVEHRYSSHALYSLVTVNIKSGAGFLHTVTIGNYSGPTVEFYDALTATGTPVIRIGAAAAPQTYTFDVSVSTGLTINPQPGTAVLPMVTTSYR